MVKTSRRTLWWIASPITTGPEDRERCREATRWAEKKLSRSSWLPPIGFHWHFGTFSRNALRQFPSFSLVRRFTRTQNSCSPRETRTHLRDILRGHKLGGSTQFGCAPRLWAGFPSAPEDRERFPTGTTAVCWAAFGLYRPLHYQARVFVRIQQELRFRSLWS